MTLIGFITYARILSEDSIPKYYINNRNWLRGFLGLDSIHIYTKPIPKTW